MIENVSKAEDLDFATCRYPMLGTPKLDGIRFYTHGGHLWSASNRPIPNILLQEELRKVLPDHLDGELFVPPGFNTSQSVVMSHGNPINGIHVYLFDQWSRKTPYKDRIVQLNETFKTFRTSGWKKLENGHYSHPRYCFYMVPLFPVWLKTAKAVENYYEAQLQAGYEGIILRDPVAPYIFGRSHSILKYKPFDHREALILGVEQLMHNGNEAYIGPDGKQKRSSRADGLIPLDTLGSFHVRDIKTGVEFKIGGGPGLTSLLRNQLWAKRLDLTNRILQYRCFAYGEKEKPRQPQFIGFRDERDMSSES